MGFAAASFVAVFLLIASGGLILFYREAMIQRISDVVSPRDETGNSSGDDRAHRRLTGCNGASSSIASCRRARQKFPSLQQRLIRAGYRSDSAVTLFLWCEDRGSSCSLRAGFRYRSWKL